MMVQTVNEKTFNQEVLEASIPVIVNFWAPWCGLCRIVEPLLPQFQATSPTPIKLVRVNADESLRLAKTYRLTTLPTLLWFERGQIIYRLDSFQDPSQLRTTLKSLLDSLPVLSVK